MLFRQKDSVNLNIILILAVNYRLKQEDIAYIFDHGDVEMIIVDKEYIPLLEDYRAQHPNIPIIVDTDTDATEGELTGPFDEAVLEGLKHDSETGSQGWEGLESQAADEESTIALAYTSGTTARPKGVEFNHRSAYLATLGNIIESGLNYNGGRARYLWTLPMFHAMGSCIFFLLKVLHTNICISPPYRLDIPVGSDSCSWNPLLSSQDRLSRNLEIAERRTYHPFQCRTHCEYLTLQRKRSRETA